MSRFRSIGAVALLALSMLLMAPAVLAPAYAEAPVGTTCYDLLVDGGFETPAGWTLSVSPVPPMRVTSPVQSGAWAMRLGNLGQQPNQASYSSIQQTVAIPANAVSASITFAVWTQTQPPPSSDRQELILLPPGATAASATVQPLWIEQSNAPFWRRFEYNINNWIGNTVVVYFNVYNDGLGGITGMVVDSAMLTVCMPAPATPTPTPTLPAPPTGTPWPTALPPGCRDLIANGGFEWDGAWVLGPTTLMPFYAGPPTPVHSGARSMALGAVPPNRTSVDSYSSAQQVVTIPATVQTAQLRFWYYPSSTAAAGGLSRQEVILLDPLAFGETVAVLWRVTQNNNAWLSQQIDLTPYRGRTLSVYFNARNGGGGTLTSMILDDVELWVCGGIVPFEQSPSGMALQAAVPAALSGTPLAASSQLPVSTPLGRQYAQLAQPLPQATTISVASPTPAFSGPMPTRVAVPTEEARAEQPSLLDRLKLNLTPAALAVMVFLIILGAVLLVVYLANRRDRDGDQTP